MERKSDEGKEDTPGTCLTFRADVGMGLADVCEDGRLALGVYAHYECA